ncbi:run domain Beclin-1-interacting and cysteine-rich domain-containing protein isoform X2 [Clupea harengus]|uniref:Run domain Beclin-1-interacting and cysteine-rich domain-containing protein isoform X2 n=1 Tax=Clupea harengus TaxID=7950 RepID=A0A6P8G4S0_CLUHA|nr:run domain Beclin-1-interacting and cysteine-rich domain-containing protein isoform X2 [Clupea harengus]
MESPTELEILELRREHWKLLSSLKTTVEGLLSTNNPIVWSRYGGLERLHKDMNSILSHGLKNEQVYNKQRDYWRFVWCVRYISPNLATHVEQFSQLEPVLSSGMQVQGESYKAERWLLHSLQVHSLSAQLKPLLKHQNNTCKYYNDEAFVLSEPHVSAMFQCLEAVEQNNPRLLALIDTVRLSHLKDPLSLGMLKSQSLCVLPGAMGNWRTAEAALSGLSRRMTTSQCSLREGSAGSPLSLAESTSGATRQQTDASDSGIGAPWECGGGGGGAGEQQQHLSIVGPSCAVPRISLTESPCAAAAPGGELGDSAEALELDDGPEYLAIGNLGQRSRRDSQGSTRSSGQGAGEGPSAASGSGGGGAGGVQGHASNAQPRRCSFSEGQRGSGRGHSKGHTRSLSDTGVTQKRRLESAGENACGKDYDPFSPNSSGRSTPSSLYMESNGSQYSSIPDGMFRKPSEGQSLISYLSEQDFGSCADLEKENAHFSISESLIAAIELMKCNMRRQQEDAEEEVDSDSEIQQLKQKIRMRRQLIRRSREPPSSLSQHGFHSTDSGGSRRSSQDSVHLSDSGSAGEIEECELKDADIKRSVMSSSRSFLSSESISPSCLQSNSAESVAMGLLRQFEGMQLPAASELDWLVPEHDAPQKLLPIPDSLPISPDDGEHADIYKLRIRVRGNLEWAPPRPQIIFNIHPAPKRKVVVAKQNYRCAGCGTRIDPDYIKRLRYCEYLGRYFCQCCHENAQAVVPGRVLRKWDFSKYYVSNFARDLLGKIAGDPLFNPNDINSSLYKKVKALEAVRVLRVQLLHMKNLFKTCRLAKEVLDQFDSVPGHLTEDLHLFSLNDLSTVRSGDLAPRLRELLRQGTAHVASCVLCQAKGFVCEFCGNDKDIIFPFELNKCERCEDCKACYHRVCFKGSKECPRCQRLAERRERMARKNMEEQEDLEEDEGGGGS